MPHASEPLPSRLWPRVQIMPRGGRACNRKIGAMNSVIRGCALLLLHALQLAFPRDAFVRFVHASYPIFKLAVSHT